MTTFLSGGVCPLLQAGGPASLARLEPIRDGIRQFDLSLLQIAWIASRRVTFTLFALAVRGHLAMAKQNPNASGFGPALAYLILQTLGTLMAAFYFPLYLATLAIHYVEYHVLMVPRCFNTTLDRLAH